jgi:zinc/manganese transport system substrate-binding protein
MRYASLLVSVGLTLEDGWLPQLARGTRSPKLLDTESGALVTGQFIDALEVPAGFVDRAQGDVHPMGNPHFQLDPKRIQKVVLAISERLAKLDSENSTKYKAQAEKFNAEIETKLSQWQARVNKSGVKKVIAYHKTMTYFFDRFGIQQVAAIEPKPGVPPTAKHIMETIQAMKSQGIHCVLNESFFETTAGERLAKEGGGKLKVVATEVGAVSGTEDYFKLMDSIVTAIEACK